jgi:hypothetical protein
MEKLKKDLSRRLSMADPANANFFAQEGVETEMIPTPFLTNGGIVRVTDYGARMVRPFYVGYAGADFVAFLAGNREAFKQLCAQGTFAPGTDADRVTFLRTLLETTAAQPSRFFLLSRAEEVRPRPHLTPEEETAFKQFIDKYRGVIHAPAMQSAGSGWSGAAFALVNVDLVKYDVTLESNGTFDIREKVLERNLPIPMVIH